MQPADNSRERILHLLKTKGPQTAAQLAKRLKVTPMAVRQHLYALTDAELTAYADERRKVGRPARVWRVTDAAAGHFPDSHGELAVGMLAALKAAFGKRGMDRLIAERTRAQVTAYSARIPKRAALGKRVAALAAIRREEGYMAEWSRDGDRGFLLLENNCPICAAAAACQGLCAGELELFQTVLGPNVTVDRTEYILTGDRRCAYRITPRRARA